MTDTTARLGYEKPATTDPVSALRTSIRDNADKSDTEVRYDQGPLSNRPPSTPGSPGIAGRLYRATDDLSGGAQGTLYRDTGTGWVVATEAGASVDNAIVFAIALGG